MSPPVSAPRSNLLPTWQFKNPGCELVLVLVGHLSRLNGGGPVRGPQLDDCVGLTIDREDGERVVIWSDSFSAGTVEELVGRGWLKNQRGLTVTALGQIYLRGREARSVA